MEAGTVPRGEGEAMPPSSSSSADVFLCRPSSSFFYSRSVTLLGTMSCPSRACIKMSPSLPPSPAPTAVSSDRLSRRGDVNALLPEERVRDDDDKVRRRCRVVVLHGIGMQRRIGQLGAGGSGSPRQGRVELGRGDTARRSIVAEDLVRWRLLLPVLAR